MQVVIAYDVSNDQARAKLVALLSSHGNRIQRSVFLCLLEQDDLDAVLLRSGELLDLDKDTLHVFRQCGNCHGDMVLMGQAGSGGMGDPFWIV